MTVAITGLVIFGVCALVFGNAALSLAWALAAALRGAAAKGRVVRVSVTRTRRRDMPHSHVAFTTAAGQAVEFREFRPSYATEGTTVAVRYLPGRPRRATIAPAGELWPHLLLVGGITAVAAALTAWSVVSI